MRYELKFNDYTLTVSVDCAFGDEEFLINGYEIEKLVHTADFSSVGGGIETSSFSKEIYSDFNEMYRSEIMETLNDDALEISKKYHEYKKERTVEAK